MNLKDFEITIDVMDEKQSDFLFKLIDYSKPNDIISLNSDDLYNLSKFWTQFVPDDSSNLVPSDIFFANTIPLPDLIIKYDNGVTVRNYRIVMFMDFYDEFMVNYATMPENKSLMVGSVIQQFDDGHEIAYPFVVTKDDNKGYLPCAETCCFRTLSHDLKPMQIPRSSLYSTYTTIVKAWYGIQIALLNPITKEIFSKSGKEKVRDMIIDDKCNTYKKGPTRYIKRTIVNTAKLFESFEQDGSSGKKFERKTLAWRVIGHWRKYKNGKVIFIKPYWKGFMKNIANQKCRNRKVELPEAVGEI